MVYHNITPPEYFRGVNPRIEAEVAKGRAQLGTFRDKCMLALADSEFNRRELESLGYANSGVLPLAFTIGDAQTASGNSHVCCYLAHCGISFTYMNIRKKPIRMLLDAIEVAVESLRTRIGVGELEGVVGGDEHEVASGLELFQLDRRP